MKLLIVVITYEASNFIESLLDRVPRSVAGVRPTILVADDASRDGTFERARAWAERNPDRDVRVHRNERNLGYGGNQKACYARAIEEGTEAVVLLHGDGQYPPERIEALVEPILHGTDDVVFGSRMAVPGAARAGGMPMARYLGNRTLSRLLNRCSGEHLTEWFCGFRAYRVGALQELDLASMPDDFHFDIAVMQALLLTGRRIVEVPIPTCDGSEVSRVPLLRTGLEAALSAVVHLPAHRRRPRGRPAGAHVPTQGASPG